MDPITLILIVVALAVLGGLGVISTSPPPPSGVMECVRLNPGAMSGTVASAAAWVAPWGGRIVAVRGGVGQIGGTVDPTDVDLDPEIGTVDILSAPIPAVNGSAIAVGGLAGTLEDTEAELTFAAGDVIHLDVTFTGGSAPTADGIWCEIWYVRS